MAACIMDPLLPDNTDFMALVRQGFRVLGRHCDLSPCYTKTGEKGDTGIQAANITRDSLGL
jgi:hypothetical protein